MERGRSLAELGPRMRGTRERKGMTQKELASRIGVSAPQLCHYEAGNHIPSLATFLRIVEALEVTPNDLLGGLWLPNAQRQRLI
jgi:transcriptional regulator with XRE-family HTH domain